MINLFEYQNRASFCKKDFADLEKFLDEIWNKREVCNYWGKSSEKKQRFLRFFWKDFSLKSNNYIGFIYFNGHRINLLPKIFYDSKIDIEKINRHILWWLSYCSKIRFPNYKTNIGDDKSDIFEIFIYLFAKYTRELLSKVIYQQYDDVYEELSFVRGSIDINRYINDNYVRGRWHKLFCRFDSFEMDNKFNRIIKYVSKILNNISINIQNKKLLKEILFILDDTSDEMFTADDCLGIRFNPMLEEFNTVRDYCYLFLNNCISYSYKNELKLFAFLIPMEFLFEGFVSGFIKKELPEIKVRPQTRSNLDKHGHYSIMPDLILEYNGRRIIADTKYKIYENEKIEQSDIYQMIAYAVRLDINDIIIFYPNRLSYNDTNLPDIEIDTNNRIINISAHKLPIASMGGDTDIAGKFLKERLMRIF